MIHRNLLVVAAIFRCFPTAALLPNNRLHRPRSTGRYDGVHLPVGVQLSLASENVALAEELQRLVENIPEDDTNSQLSERIFLLEQTLSHFVQESKRPRPPGTPPPLRILGNDDDMNQMGMSFGNNPDLLIDQAGRVLHELRVRLEEETEALRLAEAALEQSIREEDILRRAEEALQRSIQAAEKRKQAAILKTAAAVASTEQIRNESEQVANTLEINTEEWATQLGNQQLQSSNENDMNFLSQPQSSNNSTDTDTRRTMPISATLSLGATSSPPLSDFNQGPGSLNQQSPQDVPVLYNWVQQTDGSIRGQIQNSPRFQDGVSIATSAVPGVVGTGTVVETLSGSK